MFNFLRFWIFQIVLPKKDISRQLRNTYSPTSLVFPLIDHFDFFIWISTTRLGWKITFVTLEGFRAWKTRSSLSIRYSAKGPITHFQVPGWPPENWGNGQASGWPQVENDSEQFEGLCSDKFVWPRICLPVLVSDEKFKLCLEIVTKITSWKLIIYIQKIHMETSLIREWSGKQKIPQTGDEWPRKPQKMTFWLALVLTWLSKSAIRLSLCLSNRQKVEKRI